MGSLRGWWWSLAVFVLGIAIVGVPYAMTPYSQADFTAFLGPGLLVLVLAGALAIWLGKTAPWLAGIAVAAVIPVATAVRIGSDVALDPTSHNLWPFEFVFAVPLGLAAGGAAVLLGLGLARLFRRV